MPQNSSLKAAISTSWDRAKLIARHLGIPLVEARSAYARLPDKARDDAGFWGELQRADGRSTSVRNLKDMLQKTQSQKAGGKVFQRGNRVEAPAAKPAPSKKIVGRVLPKVADPEVALRRLILDVGLIRSRVVLAEVEKV